MASETLSKVWAHDDYAVGWVCALPKERTAATAILDSRHADLPKPPNDPNMYTLGSIGKHNVVIACLPKGKIGNNSAATVATWMISTFPSIKFGLMVGIGGGVPPKVRLGDVVVSTPVGQFPGVVQWDFGKAKEGGSFERTGSLNNPPNALLAALTKLETDHELSGSRIPEYLDDLRQRWPKLVPKYLRSDSLEDVLFKANYNHANKKTTTDPDTLDNNTEDKEEDEEDEDEESCRFCDKTKIVKRKPREMRVLYGLIASGNQVIKDATFRDSLNKKFDRQVLCVDMEAAGLMDNFPCIVIRGICDYADSHKNKKWQEYAAVLAAAFGKEFLEYVQANDLDREPTANDILGSVYDSLFRIEADVKILKTNEDLEILDWLTKVDYGPQQSDYLQRRQPGTGQWLLESGEFQTWLNTSKQTLFCPGIPGAGKTILTSVVIEDLNTRFYNDKSIGIAYLYCNFRRQNEQNIDNLLASLLKQLAESQIPLPTSVKDLYNRHKTRRTRPSIDEISSCLQLVVITYSRVFIIIDALDECQASHRCRMNLLLEIFSLQAKYKVNFFATSRHIPEITEKFQTSISLEIRASGYDILKYIDGHLSQLPSFVNDRPDLKDEVKSEIVKAVDGMFLLAQLHLDSLNGKRSPKAIRLALKKLPSGSNAYDDAYKDAMYRIEGQLAEQEELAKHLLTWITCANRPLTTSEFQHALAVEIGEPELDEENISRIEDLITVCAGLVTIDEESGIIRLVHYTTQEYFDRTQSQWFPNAETNITMICITYLSFNTFECGYCQNNEKFEERAQLNKLSQYAAQNWGHHARRASDLNQSLNEDPSLKQAVLAFLENHAKVEAACQGLLAVGNPSGLSNYSQNFVKGMTGFHLAAYLGVEAVVPLIISRIDVESKDSEGQSPLLWAAREGHAAFVKLLLDTNNVDIDSTDDDGRSPLSWAAERGHEAVTRLLLDTKASINSFDKNGHTPLLRASMCGHEEVVKLLVDKGAEINALCKTFSTALFAALTFRNEAVAKFLIDNGADVNAPGDGFCNSFHAASFYGHKRVVKLLIDKGADINALCGKSGTPFNALCEKFGTAFNAALHNNHWEVMKILIDEGADINIKNKGLLGTALQAALSKEHKTAAKLLRKAALTEEHEALSEESKALSEEHEAVAKLLRKAALTEQYEALSEESEASFEEYEASFEEYEASFEESEALFEESEALFEESKAVAEPLCREIADLYKAATEQPFLRCKPVSASERPSFITDADILANEKGCMSYPTV